MLRWTFLIVLCWISFSLSAHEANKAHFNLIQNNSYVEVFADLPWTIRNAILQFNPRLKTSKHKEEFDSSFTQYVKLNLILKDCDDNSLELISVDRLERKSHSHSEQYSFKFVGKQLCSVKNTFFFSIHKEQINFHQYSNGNKKLEFFTSQDQSVYVIKKKNSIHTLIYIILFISLVIGVTILIRKFRN